MNKKRTFKQSIKKDVSQNRQFLSFQKTTLKRQGDL